MWVHFIFIYQTLHLIKKKRCHLHKANWLLLNDSLVWANYTWQAAHNCCPTAISKVVAFPRRLVLTVRCRFSYLVHIIRLHNSKFCIKVHFICLFSRWQLCRYQQEARKWLYLIYQANELHNTFNIHFVLPHRVLYYTIQLWLQPSSKST